MILISLSLFSCSKEDSCNYIYDYYPFMIKGEIFYERGELNKAYNSYHKAFCKCTPRNTKGYYEIDKMARICAKKGLIDEAISMIELQIKNGFTIKKYSEDILFELIFKSPQGVELLNKYDVLRQDYLNGINKELVNRLILMSQKDQQYRGMGLYQKKREEQELIDAENEKYIFNIFENYGYPEEHITRYSHSEIIRLETILLHTNDSIRNAYFLPKLKEFVHAGKCDPKIYAKVADQLLLYNGLPQKYGTYTTKSGALSNFANLEELNKSRISIGLPTLEDKEIIHHLKIKNYPDTYGIFFANKN